MSQNAMPFLVINLASEMLFVLHTRLVAQKIDKSKSEQILHDVTSNTFCKAFLDELFRPQELYSPMATRRIFTTLSDSSIMKLSENSMTKLFDLMVMAFKQQLYTMQHPREVLECTLNHLDDLYRVVPMQTYACLQETQARVLQLARKLPDSEYALIRQSLMNFALYYRVRVSLFLEDGRQLSDSSFVLPPIEYLAPAMTTEAPGVIRTFRNGAAAVQVPFPHPDSQKTVPPHIPRNRWVSTDPTTRFSRAGHNMYLNTQQADGRDVLAQQTYELNTAARTANDRETLQAYNGEMNFLLQLVQGRKPHGEFKLNLFDDDDGTAPPPPSRTTAPTPASATSAPPATSSASVANAPIAPVPAPAPAVPALAPAAEPQVYRTDATAVKAQNERLMGIIGGLEKKNSAAGAQDDLLDIMDDI